MEPSRGQEEGQTQKVVDKIDPKGISYQDTGMSMALSDTRVHWKATREALYSGWNERRGLHQLETENLFPPDQRLGPVVQKPVNANLGLKVNQGFCFLKGFPLLISATV